MPKPLAVRIDFNVHDSHSSIEALLRRLSAVWTRPRTGEIRIDFSRCQYLGPAAVAILAMAQSELPGEPGIEFVPPKNPQLLAYCRWSGLLSTFGLEGPPGEIDHPENVTIPLRRFRGFDLGNFNAIFRLIRRFMDLGEVAEDILRVAMTELMQNISDHALSEVGAILSARAFRQEKEIRFVLADGGVGIPTTMRGRYPNLQTDEQALFAAFEPNRSAGTRRSNRGLGLKYLEDVVQQNGGSLVAVSLRGIAYRESGRVMRSRGIPSGFPGTLILVRFRIDNDIYGEDREPAGDVEV